MIGFHTRHNLQVKDISRQHEIDNLPATVVQGSVPDRPAIFHEVHVAGFLPHANDVLIRVEDARP